ncbi:MAG: hypothetical protein GY716_04675 [bacterium]|nr:hypothetical protein [bacterium]
MPDSNRLRQELRRIRELIAADPAILARFDMDGNGEIDGHEWEQVRRLVTIRLERQVQEEAERRQMTDALGEEGQVGPGAGSSSDAAVGGVAQGIYEQDLHAEASPAASAGAIGDLRQVVLRQEGGAKQLFGGMFRREYSILGPDGSPIGTVKQRENEMLQNMTNRDIFSVPDLHFDIFDSLGGERWEFQREEGLARERIGIFDERGLMVAWTAWRFSLVWRKYEVCSCTGTGRRLIVQNQLLKPWTLAVLSGDQTVGRIERGFSGLGGLLSGGNQMRLVVEPDAADAPLMWALIAAALLNDLANEEK